MPNLLDTRTTNYLELIGNGRVYHVPPYQRDYSWREEHWEDLWSDIRDLVLGLSDHHYLGALVVEARGDRDFVIIDGQQRLTTLSLASLAVIRRLESMAEGGSEPEDNRQRSTELRNRFVGERDPASLIESSRLHLNETDNPFYQDYLIQLRDHPNPRGLSGSNRLLLDCHRYFVRQLDDPELSLHDGSAVARLLAETIARKLLFIVITVDNAVNAFTVFETLNARGVELTTTDLLKNYLFSLIRVPADQKTLQRRWLQLTGTVGQARFPGFLRYHLLCRFPKVRSRQLFRLLRDETRTGEDVFSLLAALESRGELFAALLDPDHGYWRDLQDARTHVLELSLFRVKQPMPLLFAAWERFQRADFVRTLKLISVISFRYSVVSGLNTNQLEPVYHEVAKAVLDGDATTPACVFHRLARIYVDDAKMRQDFASLEVDTRNKRKLAKYILARLEQHTSGRHCDPVSDPATIEHVLPENPGEDWDLDFPGHHQDEWVYRLGNLSLLEASPNRDVGNDGYPAKRPRYAESQYSLSRAIADMAPEHWTSAQIESRQKGMARVAVHVWRTDFA